MHILRRGATLALLPLIAAAGQAVSGSAQPAGLKIVVLAGEDAVNIIQQKTAVAPMIEVRDRNNLPVSGVLVTFAINGGKAATFAGGASTFTVTTDTAGRAAASPVVPLSKGRMQIHVSAAHQGQTTTATITQTNVATASEAAQIAAAAGAGGAAVGAAAGGGGLSGAAIGGIVAAVGGGAVVAAKAAGGASSGTPSNPTAPSPPSPTAGPPPTPPPPAPAPTTYSGNVAAQFVVTTTTTGGSLTTTCESTRAINGTLSITLLVHADGTVSGTAQTTGTVTEVAFTVSQSCQALPGPAPFGGAAPVTGSTGNLSYTFSSSGSGSGVTSTVTTSYTGALSNGVISGTMVHTDVTAGQGQNGTVVRGNGSVTFPVTLR